MQKLNAITKTKCDIIFICDIRLNTYQQNYAIHDLTKNITFKGYDFFYNSKRASRGVGILLKKSLSYTVNNSIADYDDNYLLLDITILNFRLILGSVYGPNSNGSNFYTNLDNELKNLNCNTVILGGDWNATWDSSGNLTNLDVLNMAGIPSRQRSEAIRTLCEENNLTEPFRVLNPSKLEYTYVPNAQANLNRSRIDFSNFKIALKKL